MHVLGRDGKDSKTECMCFPAFPGNEEDESNINIEGEGHVSFTTRFKYLGSFITSEQNDELDVDARIAQANKAIGALRNYFRCKQVGLRVKRLIYLAIPINLVLWGAETWALTDRSMKKLAVFHHRCIRSILQINMHKVKEKRIKNKEIRTRIELHLNDS
eukprot:scaffold69384_cov30-Attheya_sp.AAC.1